MFMVAAGTADAAPVSGMVLDSDSLEPVAGARVVVVVAGQEFTTQTDTNGNYRFADVTPGTAVIRLVAAQYFQTSETIEIDVLGVRDHVLFAVADGAAAQSGNLTDTGSASETIIITGKAPLVVTSPGHTELDRNELTKMPGARGDAMQAIKNLPGVAATSGFGPGAGDIVIRGSAPEDSTLLIDGIEIPLIYHFFGLQSVVPSEFIEDIEFIPGGFGVEEGRSTGGVVQIHTRPSLATEWKGFAELSFINVGGYLEAPLWPEQNLSATLAFRRSMVDFVVPLAIPDDVDVSFTTAPQYYDGQLRVDWRPNDRHRVAVMGLLSFDLLSLINDEENPDDPVLTGRFENETQFAHAIASWHYTDGPVTAITRAAVGSRSYRFQIGNERYLRNEAVEITAREDVTWKPISQLALRAGGNLTLGYVDHSSLLPLPPQEGMAEDTPDFSDGPLIDTVDEFTSHRAAAYVSAQVRPVPAVTVTPGMRLDYYQRIDEATWLPRLALSWDVAPAWTLRGAVGRYSRPLSEAEELSDTLKPELADQYVVGADYRVAEGVRASVSGFYTDRSQLVVQDTSQIMDDTLDAYVNSGTGTSYGGELMVRMKRSRFFGWLAYTLSRNTRVDQPGMEERLFDFDQTHNLVAVASVKLGAWNLGARWQYTTGTPFTPVEGSVYDADSDRYQAVYGDINSDRLEPGHQLDLRVDRTFVFADWTLSAYLDITNVYANAQTLDYEYNFDYTERGEITELPIFPAIGVRGTF